jgi:hypothetical protein
MYVFSPLNSPLLVRIYRLRGRLNSKVHVINKALSVPFTYYNTYVSSFLLSSPLLEFLFEFLFEFHYIVAIYIHFPSACPLLLSRMNDE